ncbi:hypothetical protein CRUP_009976 [Coryphaenoides rupestris]|nr:hypothetical protein CRUP_009976 [Coryphaenoides rupestris]
MDTRALRFMMDDGGLLTSWEEIQEEITRQKGLYDDLMAKQKKLEKSRADREEMTESFRERSLKTINSVTLDKVTHDKDMDSKKDKLDSIRQEQTRLREELEMVEAALCEQEKKNTEVQKVCDVLSVRPKREVVFQGETLAMPAKPLKPQSIFDIKALIKYPMDGGTALITFDEEIVAQNVLSLRNHRVMIDKECFMDTRVCPRRILVSNLPDMDTDVLLDKLELHFSKSVHGGGEVVSRHLQDDVRKVVLEFLADDSEWCSLHLTTRNHKVQLGKKKDTVQVEPFVTGINTHLDTTMLMCKRTVLLTDIPAVMEPDSLLDVLEIFFQKGSNGGGEIASIAYNAVGHTTTALFRCAEN